MKKDELEFDNEHVTEIPHGIMQLVNVWWLNLDDNEIQEIPHEITQLINLRRLFLCNNKIKNIQGIVHNVNLGR